MDLVLSTGELWNMLVALSSTGGTGDIRSKEDVEQDPNAIAFYANNTILHPGYKFGIYNFTF